MMRIALELILLFLAPAAAYLGYMLLMHPGGLGGALLVLGTLVYYGVRTDTTKGGIGETYTPARIKDGQIEPGHFK
jgi:hypothetical protein